MTVKKDRRMNYANRDYIKTFWKSKTDREIASVLMVSKESITVMRKRMGLVRVVGGGYVVRGRVFYSLI
jgi:hypothetical protein